MIITFAAPSYCNKSTEMLPECPVSMHTWIVGGIGWIAIGLIFLGLFVMAFKAQTRSFERRTSPSFFKSREYQLEYRRQRTVVLRMYGRRCIVCGSTDRVEVHHQTPRARGGSNSLDNLVPLCHAHHMLEHRGRRF